MLKIASRGSERVLIYGTGVDIIEVERVRRAINADNTDFISKTFTDTEINYCESNGGSIKAEYYAARFAAKEAFLKALGTGWRYGISWGDIEVINDMTGKPSIKVHGIAEERCRKNKIVNINLSISRIGLFTTAFVILEN